MEYNSNIKIWKDFPDFEGLYQACTDGQVRSVDHNTMGKDGKLHHIKGRILKQAEDKDGYKRVVLCKNGVNYYLSVHRIIAMTFLPNPDNLPVINHKDIDPSNNKVENLMWCTVKENNDWGDHKEKVRATKHATMGDPVVQIDLNNNIAKIWHSAAIASDFGYSRSSISQCVINKKKYHKGYKWVKLENYKPELSKEEIEYYKNMPIPPFKRSPAYNDRAIVQLTLDGQYVREWPAIACVNDYGYNSICVGDCVRHRQRTTNEYRWMYKEEYQNTKEIETELKDYRGKRKVVQLTLDGKLVKIWDCARDVEKCGFGPQAVNGCCRHKDNRTRHKGFIWEYLEEYETGVFVKNESTKGTKQPVVQLSLDNKFIKQWDCIADTAKEGFNKNCVNACCIGRKKTHKGFKWMYLKDYEK